MSLVHHIAVKLHQRTFENGLRTPENMGLVLPVWCTPIEPEFVFNQTKPAKYEHT